MTIEAKHSKTKSESLLPFLLMIVVATVGWFGYWYWINRFIPDGDNPVQAQALRGEFGDMFGAINALYSAMAFSVLVYTMWLQRTELRLQREELRDTREELAKSATAQAQSQLVFELQLKTIENNARHERLVNLMGLLHAPELRDARHKVRNANSAKDAPDEIRKLCSIFDFAGLLVRRQLIDRTLFLDYWAASLRTITRNIMDFLNAMQADNMTGAMLYADCVWLLKQAEGHTRQEPIAKPGAPADGAA
jgi:hypothetical protein